MRIYHYFAITALLTLLAVTCVFGSSRYDVTDIGALGGKHATVYDINNKDQVVGTAEISSDGGYYNPYGWHAFLWDHSRMRDLDHLENFHWTTRAVALNDHAEIIGIGSSSGAVTSSDPFVWRNNKIQELGPVPPSWIVGDTSEHPLAMPYDINNRGQIVGMVTTEGGDRVVMWSNGHYQFIGTQGGPGNEARAINNRGEVVGGYNFASPAAERFRAFIWRNGEMKELGTLGGVRSQAYDINDAGDVVGTARNSKDADIACLWVKGKMQGFGTLGGRCSEALGINSRKQVVGWSHDEYGKQMAFLWENGKLHNLNEIANLPNGWVLASAVAINDGGVIVCNGTKNGVERAFLLRPAKI